MEEIRNQTQRLFRDFGDAGSPYDFALATNPETVVVAVYEAVKEWEEGRGQAVGDLFE